MKKLIITIAAVLTLAASTLPAMLARANDAGPLDSVAISPANANVAVNGTNQLTAVAKDAFNHDVANVTYNWSVVAGGGTINATSGLFTAGNVTGTFNGTVQVTAVQGNITLTANGTVTVAIPGQLVRLEVHPEAVTLPVNGTQQFTAVAKDAFNQNAAGVNFVWSVVAGGGTVNSTSGLFTAGNATGTFNGTVQVTAVQGTATLNASTTVIVGVQGILDHIVISPASADIAVNGTRQFTAVVKDIFNNNVPNVTYNWSVIAGGGTINATNGLFTAGNTTGTFNGTVQVTATTGDIAKTANATVTVVAKAEKKPVTPPGFDKGNKNGRGNQATPPGWDKGNKNGWDGQPTPPGLGKNNGNNNQGQQGEQHGNPGQPPAVANHAHSPATGNGAGHGKGKN